MPKTRSTKAAAAKSTTGKSTASPATTSSKYALDSKTGTPPNLFVLPTKATPEARIVTLPNPRHSQPARYLVCPETGIYEFTKIAAPKTTPRSWLIESTPNSAEHDPKGQQDGERKAQITTGADLYLATPIDPLFLIVPALADLKAAKGSDEQKRLFLSSDDHFDKLPEECSHLSEILRWKSTRSLIEGRMAAVCDTVDAGDESMFRLNEKKLASVILQKAQKMSQAGLPASMEETFVKKPLEAPILAQKREVSSLGTLANVDSEVSTPKTDSAESQSTITNTEASFSAVSQGSTAATSFTEEAGASDSFASAMAATAAVTQLQRTRVAFNFICASYITPVLADRLQKLIVSTDGTALDFSPLDDYLAKVSKLRSEALAVRSIGDYSRKHGRDEEEEEVRAEKKRKLEEEKKRKAAESRAVRDLKKVNTSGMKKLSEFFKKK